MSTTPQIRLDPRLELPGFRDNLDERLILLKRRLHEREVPVQLEKTGRGRFRLEVDGAVPLESVATYAPSWLVALSEGECPTPS